MNEHSPPLKVDRVAGDAGTGVSTAIHLAIHTIQTHYKDSPILQATELCKLGDAELLKRLQGKYPNGDPAFAALSPFMLQHYYNANECYEQAATVTRQAKFAIVDYKRYFEWIHCVARYYSLQGDAGERQKAYGNLSLLAKEIRLHRYVTPDTMREYQPDKEKANFWTPKEVRHGLRRREGEALTQLMRFAPPKKKWKYGLRAIYLVRRYGDARAWHRLVAALWSNDYYNITVIVQAHPAS